MLLNHLLFVLIKTFCQQPHPSITHHQSLIYLLVQFSHLSRRLFFLLSAWCYSISAVLERLPPSIVSTCPVYIIEFPPIFLLGRICYYNIITSFLKLVFLLQFRHFVHVLIRTHLFSNNCSFCCCWRSVGITVSRPLRSKHSYSAYLKWLCLSWHLPFCLFLFYSKTSCQMNATM